MPNQADFDALIFDCDGTLVDSETIAAEVLILHAAEIGLHITIDHAVSFKGRRWDECMADLAGLFGSPLPDDFSPRFRDRMADQVRERLRPMEGARELVGSLTIPYCVASSAPRAKIELSLSVTGLLPLFEGRIFSSYEVGSWKPDPGLFLHAANALGVEPSRCAVVEDSLPGVRAGLAAGMRVFAWLSEPCEESGHESVRTIGGLVELRGMLEKKAPYG